MGTDGDMDRLAGKAKEVGGKVTRDRDLESEGRTQNTAGKVENAIDDAGDTLKGAGRAVKDRVSRDDGDR